VNETKRLLRDCVLALVFWFAFCGALIWLFW